MFALNFIVRRRRFYFERDKFRRLFGLFTYFLLTQVAMTVGNEGA